MAMNAKRKKKIACPQHPKDVEENETPFALVQPRSQTPLDSDSDMGIYIRKQVIS